MAPTKKLGFFYVTNEKASFIKLKKMTRIIIQKSPINNCAGMQNICDRFDKSMSKLYPDIRPWCKKLKA